MKIAYILLTGKGGLPHYTAELANAISKHAEVVVVKPKRTTADDVFSNRLDVVNAFEPMDLSFVDIYKKTAISFKTIKGILSFKNIKIVKEIKPDVIHFSAGLIPPIHIFIRLHKLDQLLPIITTFHDVPPRKILMLPGRDFYSGSFLNVIAVNVGNFLNLLMPKIKYSKIIVHTKNNKDRLIEQGFDHPRKIVIIPHGVYSFFRNYINNKIDEEKNCILFFGNIVSSKAIDVLIDSIPLIVKEIPSIKLIIAGDGVIPKKSFEIIKKYKSNFEIHNYFIPNDKVAEFFSRANLVGIPNRKQEGHSGTLTIAYSFGKPVVTTNVGEFPELVEKMGCGLTVPPEDPKALAEAIIKLLSNDEIRKEMSRNALKRAEELSWDNIAKMHMKVYEEVLNEWRERD
ncbi:MAG: glycosyltransferase family 4 protein [Leptospiraceae bacterium]|nr:glycosyltransferase family 4 protein [Leptospiraceae bacterium]